MSDVATLRARLIAELEAATSAAVKAADVESARPIGEAGAPDAAGVLAAVARVAHYNRVAALEGKAATVAKLTRPADWPAPTTEALAAWLLAQPESLPLAAAVAEAAWLTPADAYTDRERWAHRAAERWLRDFCESPLAPLAFAVLFLADLVIAYLAAGRPRAPLLALVDAWQRRAPVPVREAKAVALRQHGALFVRAPGIASAALLSPVAEAVVADGEPFASRAPAGARLFRRRALPAPAVEQRLLLAPAPRTLDGAAVDPVLAVVSRGDWATDPRSPLRSDVADLVKLGCALARSVRLPVDDVARLLTRRDGRVKPEARNRAERAVQAGSMIVFHGNQAFQMLRAMTERGEVLLYPPDWFGGGRGVGAWRLSGALWRTRWAGAKQGGQRRMAEGIEAALAWSPPAAGGGSRLPELLRPERPGGPGPDVTIDWRRVIYLSGEPGPADDDLDARRRYQRRVTDFKEAGYRARGRAPAPAADTWEIVDVKRGALIVRASARYCAAEAAAQLAGSFEAVPLDLLLHPGRPRR